MAGEQILVVDDDDQNMKLFRDVLESTGYRTFEASTGDDAVTLTADHLPALGSWTSACPDIDGLEALRLLRRTRGRHRSRCWR